MPRYAFKAQANFPDAASRTTFGQDTQAFIDAHPALFPFPPINTDIAYHNGLTVRLVRGDLVAKTDMSTIYGAMKSQLIAHGAVSPSILWIKEQADAGGVTNSTSSSNPDALGGPAWTDHTPAIDFDPTSLG